MAENDYLSQAASFFWPQALGLDKANLKLRERIALAQMMQKRAFPKTFGEGLSAIGEALGDRKLAVELEKLDQGAQADVLKNRAPVAEISDAPVVQAAPRVPVANNADLEPEPVVAVRPPPTPIPPPNGQPGNRGDTVFPTATNGLVQPQQALPPTVIQPPPPPPPQPGGRIGDLPAGGPVNRLMTPPGPLPPGNIPAPTLNERLAPAFPGQQSAAPPPPGTPVMAAGDDVTPEEREAGRNALAQAMMQQQAARGGPQPLPTTRAATTPPPPVGGNPPEPVVPVIRAAPPAAQPIQAMPEQPGAVAGWVPAPAGKAQGVDILGPSPRETALQNFLMSKQNNPYWERSPEAQELARLKGIRELRQQELQKDREAQIARDTKQQEQHISGRMDQAERIEKARKARLEQLQIQQGLIDGSGGGSQATDPRLLGTPQSPQRSGRPAVDPVPQGAIPEVWVKDQQAKIAKTAETLDTAKPELADALNLINKARAHPAKERSLGALGGLAKLTPEGQGFAAIMDQLKGKTFLSGYQKLKGTGNVSEIEGLKTEQAQARLATAQTKEDFDDALRDLESSMRGAVERVERKMRQPVTAYQKTPDDPYAPDLGEKRGGFEYIGGDPADKRNWKRAR